MSIYEVLFWWVKREGYRHLHLVPMCNLRVFVELYFKLLSTPIKNKPLYEETIILNAENKHYLDISYLTKDFPNCLSYYPNNTIWIIDSKQVFGSFNILQNKHIYKVC